MTWRTVMITKQCKLSYKNDYLIVRDDKINMIHLSEINTIVVDSTMVSITSYLINELINKKIKILFCDEKRNPTCEVVPYYGRHNSSKLISKQIKWKTAITKKVWTEVIIQKILNQSMLLEKTNHNEYLMLNSYSNQVTLFDRTNREGHAAKVYFNALFGKEFNRDEDNDINSALNYGYSILLSNFNKEICANGYITQIGLKHKNEFNNFNLSSDLMEPFRILVDEIVYENRNEVFSGGYKQKLVNLLNKQVEINGQNYYLTNAIALYVRSIFNAIEENDVEKINFFNYQ